MENRIKYRKFSKKENDIPLFSQPWWLDTVCGPDNWSVALVEKGGNIFASMPYYIEKKYGQTIIKHPKLTQTLGIYFKYPKKQKYYKKLSFEKEMIHKLIEQLPKFDKFSKSFNYNTTNLLPFYWKGFTLQVNYTYTIENITLEELEKGFETDIRRRRRKAEELGVKVYEGSDIEKFYELNQMTFIRQKASIPYSFDFVEKLYTLTREKDASKIFFAKYKGEVIAAAFLVFDKSNLYYIMGGIDPDKRDLGGMDMVQYESIKFALKSNRVFDFEGSMIESIEKYVRSFGAIQKPYYQVTKINSKVLKIKEALK
jgi:lipid II:glycine glycyltransferase (peptidoglycan interpeptide bridge formation enzyme)